MADALPLVLPFRYPSTLYVKKTLQTKLLFFIENNVIKQKYKIKNSFKSLAYFFTQYTLLV